ncbi:fumarylacetoacetate hydrolase family protein [Pseudonocardia nematodicida]|uniref:Fumarylacetoacetate hydrolase family protein n=1 Tax=Pseudonocardia nematodicida TaxID=1206997 RepID=A0ABV1KGK6_9PSEU
MRLVRFGVDDSPARFGVLDGSDKIRVLAEPFDTASATGEVLDLADVRLRAPVLPTTKIIGVGRNYAAHAAELGNELPDRPLLFLKPASAIQDPGAPIVLPAFSADTQHEAELAVVIGRRGKDVTTARATEMILGYTVANDVTARDIQRRDVQFTRGKGFDTSCPLGPWIETDLPPGDLRVRALVDGEQRQDGHTGQMIFGVPELIADISAAFTLLPGDVILTGTPAGVGPLAAGQTVTVEVEGIGVLTNPVVDDPARPKPSS